MVLPLMPSSTAAPRCSEFARSIGVVPVGTGLRLDRILLVTVPPPWPKPALGHPLLKGPSASVTASTVTSRLFACEPFGRWSTTPVVEIFERDADSARHYRWVLDSDAAIAPLVAEASSVPLGALGALSSAAARLDVGGAEPGPLFLVCTQGSHDLCCGTSGVALARQLEASRPEWPVRCISHTGGHRFAPTLIALPEGRMWAFADLALVDRIAGRSETRADIEARSRGWWGATAGPMQVAETAVRAELAGHPFRTPRIEASPIETDQAAGGGGTRFVVDAHDLRWEVVVRSGREVPSIACEAPGGLPAKTEREYSWVVTRVPTSAARGRRVQELPGD